MNFGQQKKQKTNNDNKPIRKQKTKPHERGNNTSHNRGGL